MKHWHMYKVDVSICVPVSAVARLRASDVDMPGWHQAAVGGVQTVRQA